MSPGSLQSVLDAQLRLVAADEPLVEVELPIRHRRSQLATAQFWMGQDEFGALGCVRQHGIDINTQVIRSIRFQFAEHFGHLFANADRISPLCMDERAGVNDEALIKIAAIGAPRLLQHFVAFPVLPGVEKPDEFQQRVGKTDARAWRFVR